MKLTVLIDNQTLIDRYFISEPGFSVFISDFGKNILFDCGYSNIFIRNALMMGIDLKQTDNIILSHGHIDHTGGLGPFLQYRISSRIEDMPVTVPEFVCHPAALYTRTIEGIGNIGTLTSRNALETEGPVRETENPLWITDDIVFLGEIPTKFDFEKRTPIGILHTPEGMVPDMIPDDSALVCLAEEGIIIVTGCSHAGICSIIEYAKEVTGCDRITDVIGGFHLYDAGDDRISKTAKYLRSIRPRQLHPCHCTGNRAISLFGAVAPGEEVGVGLTLEY